MGPDTTARAPGAGRAGAPLLAVAGLGIESSTFSPARTSARDFHVWRGEAALERYPFLADDGEPAARARWRGALVGKALPGGVVTARAYAELSGELLERLAALGEIDGLHLDLHGAMTVEGLDDAEADLAERIRAVIGSRPMVSTSMDLHGNVSRRLAHASDLITCYRMAPHEDALDTRRRAMRELVAAVADGRRPLKAWIPVPVLLPGEKTSTRLEPAASLYADVARVADEPGVVDAAAWVGYAWADEPRNRAAVVVTGHEREAVVAGAERLARRFWDVRDEFRFVAETGTLDECLDAAASPGATPFVISDSGDNPTAGGAGDVTSSLARILERAAEADDGGPTLVYASLPAPAAVAAAVAAGVGGRIREDAGAAVDDRPAPPVCIDGEVRAIVEGDPDAGTEVVVRVGRVDVILTARRKPYHLESDFTRLGLDPRGVDVLVVKIGYLEPELFALAGRWMLALTPGGVDQDLARLGHTRIRRPMHPFDEPQAAPDLSARLIPASSEPLVGDDE